MSADITGVINAILALKAAIDNTSPEPRGLVSIEIHLYVYDYLLHEASKQCFYFSGMKESLQNGFEFHGIKIKKQPREGKAHD